MYSDYTSNYNSKGECTTLRKHFGENSTTWNIAHEVPDAVETDSFYTTFDTIINGYTYKTVFIYSYISGFIREDINTGKAWYLYASDTNEILIMDLSLSIADTFFC